MPRAELGGAITMAPQHATPKAASAVATALRPLLVELRAELQALLPTGALPEGAAPRCGLELGRRHAAGLDTLLTRLLAAVREPQSRAWARVAVAGVGAHGRFAVALGSDLDLRLLADDPDVAAPAAEALLYPLWDLGVSVGHQVVSIDALLESARDDLPTATALLDWRHLGGDEGLAAVLFRKAAAGLFAHSELPRFMRRLADEVSQRHARFGGSVYLLEPDVKNGQGGLRDLDVARWAARARFGVGELDELVRIGALLPREALDLASAGEVLWRIRNLLHAHAGRRSDRLTFDEQEAIAPLLGYPGDAADGAEQLMSDYYRSARTIGRGLETILSRATPVLTRRRPRDEDLGGGVRLFDGSVTVGDADLLRADPALALRALRAAVERGAPLLPWARDAMVRVAHEPVWCAALRESVEARRIFVDLCATRREVPLKSGTVMRELHDLGLLLAMIPEFSPVVGRVHHDEYHVYTVDVHSVAAVDRLAALVRGDLAADYPLACRLAADVPRPQTLFFATLLHDVGKAIGGKDHSQRGAQMARSILARLGFAPEDVDEAAHLILEHLTMYHVATRRDLDDPTTVAEFARRMGERETLRDLYLLTVADLSTTSPTSMTSWKARMLDELYLATDAALAGEPHHGSGGPGRAARVMELVLSHARDQARAPSADAPARQARAALEAWLPQYLAAMPERYLLSNTPAAVVAHAALAREHEASVARAGHPETAPLVALVPTRHPGTAEICAVATDRPGLLSAITAAIAASRLEVHAAQIHSRAMASGGVQAVDLFWVRDRGEGEAAVARSLPKLAADLQSVLSGRVDARELARRRGGAALRDRATPRVSTRVSIDDRASSLHTVIDVLTRDRPGLLFSIADALFRAGLSIAVAKINTEGTRVADVFYVSEADGSKVARGERAKAVHDAVEAALAALDS